MNHTKAYDDATIDEIICRRLAGEKGTRLARAYHIHENTVYQYCRKPIVRRYRGQMMNKFMAVN